MSVTYVKTKYEVIKETKYLRFTKLERPTKKKTDDVLITSISSGTILGFIRWYGPWRQYCFYPEGETIWNKGCLDDINEVMFKMNKEHHREKNEK